MVLLIFLCGQVFPHDRKYKILLSEKCQVDLYRRRRKHLTPHNSKDRKGEIQNITKRVVSGGPVQPKA